MSRRLQHIASERVVEAAMVDGEKVTALCGARHYPMTQLGEHVPICTPCSRRALAELNVALGELHRLRVQSPVRVPVTVHVARKTRSVVAMSELALNDAYHRFAAAQARLARVTDRMLFAVEVRNLAAHQVDALLYVRGAFDPSYDDPAARDRYVRAIATHPTVGAVAATAFLTGWATHRGGDREPFVWHRYYAGVRLEVAA